MIELSNGEITLRPFSSADRKQWRRVRAINKDWLEEWEATVPKTSKSDELKSALSFGKMVKLYRKEARAGGCGVAVRDSGGRRDGGGARGVDQRLGPPLLEELDHHFSALAQAKPSERVTFYLSEPQASTKRIVTSGGLYMKGSELHLILGNWQIVYGIPTYGMIYDRRYPMRPTAAKGFDLFFQPHEAMRRTESSWIDGILANGADEVVIDLTKLPPAPPVRLSSAFPCRASPPNCLG